MGIVEAYITIYFMERPECIRDDEVLVMPTQLPKKRHSRATGAVSSVSIRMLPILPVMVKANGRTVSAFALLDTGSEVTFVMDSVIDQLGINGQTETMEIETVSGRGRPVKSKKVEFEIESLDGLYTFQIVGARGVPSFDLTRRPVNLTKLCEMWPHLSDVRIPATTVEDVAVLMGKDHPAALEIFSHALIMLINAPREHSQPPLACVSSGHFLDPMSQDPTATI